MSKLTHRFGDILDLAQQGDFDIIVHGCNCFCTMGAGLAKSIRQRYPQAYEEDRKTESGDILKLGCFTTASAGDFLIVNAYTQYQMSRNGVDVFDYSAFELILKKLAHIYGDKRFGLPYIGMGLAQGNSERIISMILNFSDLVTAKGGSVTLVKFH